MRIIGVFLLTILFTTTIHAQGMDLPVPPVKFGNSIGENSQSPEPEPDDDDGKDPRDTPPPVIYGEEIDTENDTIIYVIDRSCSMAWDIQVLVSEDGSLTFGNRMERAKAELTRSIMALSDNFKFNILSYSCGVNQFSNQLVEATDPNKQAARTWICGLQPGGATGTGPATSGALSLKDNKTVILLTDGAPNCGAPSMSGHRIMIVNNNTQGATINVFGISASGSYRAFCQGVAADSGGSYFDIP